MQVRAFRPTETLDSEEANLEFNARLGHDFSKLNSLNDLRDRETLFDTVQFALERMDKDKYKKFRSG